MHTVALAWIFVVLLWALVEANAPNGSLLGALMTLLFWGLLPLAIVLYLMATPARRRARQRRAAPSALDPNGSGHAPGDAVAPEREES
jgi:hypothetical protein